jgi:hypothetical protein
MITTLSVATALLPVSAQDNLIRVKPTPREMKKTEDSSKPVCQTSSRPTSSCLLYVHLATWSMEIELSFGPACSLINHKASIRVNFPTLRLVFISVAGPADALQHHSLPHSYSHRRRAKFGANRDSAEKTCNMTASKCLSLPKNLQISLRLLTYV